MHSGGRTPAYALDAGETLGALNARFPATPIVAALEFDAQGNATVEPGAFARLFAPDLPARQARALAACSSRSPARSSADLAR